MFEYFFSDKKDEENVSPQSNPDDKEEVKEEVVNQCQLEESCEICDKEEVKKEETKKLFNIELITMNMIYGIPDNKKTVIFDVRPYMSYVKRPINFNFKYFTKIHVFDELLDDDVSYLTNYPLKDTDNIIIVDEGSETIIKQSFHYKLFTHLKEMFDSSPPFIYLLKGGFKN